MNTIFLYAAAFAGAFTTVAHIFVGGPKNAAPVLNVEGLSNGPKVTVSFAWHAASVLLAFISLIYLWAAINGTGRELVTATTLLCAALAVLGFIVSYRGGENPWTFPPAILFILISVLGLFSMFTDSAV